MFFVTWCVFTHRYAAAINGCSIFRNFENIADNVAAILLEPTLYYLIYKNLVSQYGKCMSSNSSETALPIFIKFRFHTFYSGGLRNRSKLFFIPLGSTRGGVQTEIFGGNFCL